MHNTIVLLEFCVFTEYEIHTDTHNAHTRLFVLSGIVLLPTDKNLKMMNLFRTRLLREEDKERELSNIMCQDRSLKKH